MGSFNRYFAAGQTAKCGTVVAWHDPAAHLLPAGTIALPDMKDCHVQSWILRMSVLCIE